MGVFEAWTRYLSAWLDRRPADMVVDSAAYGPLLVYEDPEAIFQDGWLLCDAGDLERGLGRIDHAVKKGYFAAETLSSSRHFDAVRKTPVFQALLATAERGREQALRVFRDAGGDNLLGTWRSGTVEDATNAERERPVC
jgi:hypothetical protein